MSLIHWMPEYNTRIDEIDNQHRKLVILMNDLELALDNSPTAPNTQNILNQILTFSTSHFAREEHLMDINDFHDLKFHRNEHFFFEDMVYEIEDAVTDDNVTLAQEKLSLLSDWFIDHMRETDQQYLPYCKSSIQNSSAKQDVRHYRGQTLENKKHEPKKKHAVMYRGQIIQHANSSSTDKAPKSTSIYRGQRIHKK